MWRNVFFGHLPLALSLCNKSRLYFITEHVCASSNITFTEKIIIIRKFQRELIFKQACVLSKI